jgi:hypothetical protein
MKILKEINKLSIKVNKFYIFEGILISIIVPIILLLFLNYLSILKDINIYIFLTIPFPIYLFYILFWKKPDFQKVLLESDKKLNLDERLITIWEYRNYNDPYGLMDKISRDLEEKIKGRSIKDYYHWKPSRLLKLLCVLLIFLIILNFARSISPAKNNFIVEKNEKKEEIKESNPIEQKIKRELQISKNLKGEKLTEEKRKQEKSALEKEKDKNLEKILSEWNFEEEKIMEEMKKKFSSSSNDKNKKSIFPTEKTPPSLGNTPSEGEISQNKDGEGNKDKIEQKNNLDTQEGNKGEEIGNSGENSKSNRIGDLRNLDIPTEKPKGNEDAQGSLPGTAEREQKLGKKPTPRLNTNPERVIVPSPGIDESKKRVYLIEAPSLKEEKEKSIMSLSSSFQYRAEESTSPRVIPWDLQEIIKSYFSQ